MNGSPVFQVSEDTTIANLIILTGPKKLKVCNHCHNLYEKPKQVRTGQWSRRKYCSQRCRARRLWTYRTELEWAAMELIKAKETLSGCLEFQGRSYAIGYGEASVFGKRDFAHRLIYRIMVDDIPEGMFVCHKCDNPLCINIEHLFLGTALDNNRDKISKSRDRNQHGSYIRKKMIDDLSLVEFMEMAISGVSYDNIGEIFGLSSGRVSAIAKSNGYSRRKFKDGRHNKTTHL